MKKLLIAMICYNIFVMPVYSMITDDFAEGSLKNIKSVKREKLIIQDELANELISKQLISPRKKLKPLLSDEFAEQNKIKNPLLNKVEITEYLPQITNKSTLICQKNNVFQDKLDMQKIGIKIKKNISTRNLIDEGDNIEFETIADAKIFNKLYPKGSIVNARIETVSKNKSKGVPADIVIGNFSINNNRLIGEIEKTGANRSLWVYPVGTCGIALFGLGIFIFFIRGGHAKIKTSDVYFVYVEK